MKKLIAVMMVLVMILSFPALSFAAEATDAPGAEIKTNREYAFTYMEYTDTDDNSERNKNGGTAKFY